MGGANKRMIGFVTKRTIAFIVSQLRITDIDIVVCCVFETFVPPPTVAGSLFW